MSQTAYRRSSSRSNPYKCTFEYNSIRNFKLKLTVAADQVVKNTYQTMKVMERLEADHIFRRIRPLDKSSRFIDFRKGRLFHSKVIY